MKFRKARLDDVSFIVKMIDDDELGKTLGFKDTHEGMKMYF